MKLKKLILSVLGLFIFAALSNAAGNPEIPDTLALEQNPMHQHYYCGFNSAKPETMVKYLDTDKEYPVGDYAGKDGLYNKFDIYYFIKIAINSRDLYEKARHIAFAGLCAKTGIRHMNTLSSADNYFPMHVAAFYEQEDLVNYFVKLGMKIDAIGDNDARTPLILVAGKAKEKMTRQLVDLGADVNYRDSFMKTPAAYAKEGMEATTSPALKQTYKRIYDFLKPLMTTASGTIKELIHNAASRAINYALTDKEQIQKAIRKIADNAIFRDGLILFDINGYKTKT